LKSEIEGTRGEKIKSEINKRINQKDQKQKGLIITKNDGKMPEQEMKEEPKAPSVKKIFLSESVIEKIKSPEELKKLLGVNKEEVEKIQIEKRKQLTDFQRDMYTLPENLNIVNEHKDDHVDNIIKFSAAGLIEVPITLQQKLKNVEATEKLKQKEMDNKLEEELDYLKVLKKLGPSYAKGYKNDLSRKTASHLNQVFENVFVNPNSRKRKFMKDRMVKDNRDLEKDIEQYVRKDE